MQQAHAHARKASRETGKSKLTIAAAEHESAAGEFAQAAASTGDVEVRCIISCACPRLCLYPRSADA